MKNFPETVYATKENLIQVKQKAKMLSLAKNKLPVDVGFGENYSFFKTKGLDFEEVRVYQPGDDMRLIDWRITAKHNKPYTKLYVDEKERQVFVIADMRSQMRFASQGDFKSVVVAKSASFLAFLAENKKDKFGFSVVGDDKIEAALPQQGKESSLALVDILSVEGDLKEKSQQNTSLNQALSQSEKLIRRGAMVFILSDFSDFDEEASTIIKRISRKATCSLIHVYDEMEKSFPKGVFALTDGNEISQFDTSKSSFQKAFEKDFEERVDMLQSLTQNNKVGYLPLLTNGDYLYNLADYCRGGLI